MNIKNRYRNKKPDKKRALFKDRQHVPHVKGATGAPTESLIEPVPDYAKRTGDCIINAKTLKQGTDNNTMIILGRDRTGLGEYHSKNRKNFDSGFGSHMGAGAIDIVVGRMAPFAVTSVNADSKNKPISVGPAYRTKEYTDEDPLTQTMIGNYDDNGVLVKPMRNHPGVLMDAARIYISQMCLIDDYFGIAKEISTSNNALNMSTEVPRPTTISSAIMIKADEVRMHSRKDIKIVTDGPGENYDSQGNRITTKGRIHLMAGNLAQNQQPVVLGNDLVIMLNDFLQVFQEYVNNVTTFVTQQIKFNTAVTGHVHTELGASGMPTLPSLLTLKLGAETTYKQLANNVIGGGLAIGADIERLKAYVIPGDAKINSDTVTTS